MKKVISALTLSLLIVMSLSLFTQAQAAWYDWLGWSKIKSVFIKEKSEDKKETPVETQNQGEPNSDTTKTTPEEFKPVANTQNLNVENTEVESLKTEIESRKTEIVTLRADLDNLYKAHNGLIEDHNKLLKYTTDEILDLTNRYNNLVNIVSKPSVPQVTDTSNLERKVSNLESKVKDICKMTFSGLLLFGDCPSVGLLRESLEYRIEKLERLIK